ncbi:S1 family peptidase [Pseudonocardiaceae bacterium YIM PH 21723]|nr:S1 family peptidase [Pseudonocardiaceae bacterium YIM PH 21723]
MRLPSRADTEYFPAECPFSLHRSISMNRIALSAVATAALAAAAVIALQPAPRPVSSDAVAYTGELAPGLLQAYQRDLGLNEQQARETIGQENRATAVEDQVTRALGDQLAGTYYEPATHRLIANVTDEQAAKVAREHGAEPKFVQRSGADLRATKAKLDAAKSAAGKDVTRWGVDEKNNTITVTAVSADAAKAFVTAAGLPQDAVKAVVNPNRMHTTATIVGGMEYGITTSEGGFLCSVGFSAKTSAGNGFVSAGHCGSAGDKITIGGQAAGSFSQSRFPGNDYSFVSTPGATLTNQVTGHSQRITGTTSTAVGGSICRSGRTTGYHCGTVQQKNVTVNYAEGTVTGLTETTACSDHGDSGGSFVTGANAQGVLSGGSGDCSSATGDSVFQPIAPALSALGATLVLS